jgi:hypothetical protein
MGQARGHRRVSRCSALRLQCLVGIAGCCAGPVQQLDLEEVQHIGIGVSELDGLSYDGAELEQVGVSGDGSECGASGGEVVGDAVMVRAIVGGELGVACGDLEPGAGHFALRVVDEHTKERPLGVPGLQARCDGGIGEGVMECGAGAEPAGHEIAGLRP